MLTWVYRLSKKIKKWFFPWIYSLVWAETNPRGWDKFRIELLHILLDFDSHLIQRINLIGMFDFIH